jgi:acetylornithine/N-succinyldiaminopimelate aminotransferase
MLLTQRQLFLQHNAQTSSSPLLLEFERAEGMYIYDTEGTAYMDLISGIGVSNIGHCYPAVVKAVQKQAETYMHLMVYGEYVQSPQVKFAEKLASVLPDPLKCVYFVNSGAEATEGALKLAKRFTGRSEIISCHRAYHGSTHGALSVMGNEYFKQAYRPLLPDVRFIYFNNERDLDNITTNTACVIIETIQGEAGVRVPSDPYMQKLRKKCDETGTLLILDEIQTGFGRTGTLFAFEQFGIVPDILLLAKGMAGGMPLGAFIASKEIMSVLADNPLLGHITTFGGNPVCCAAGLATLETILNLNLMEGVPRKERLFRELLVHPIIAQVRGKGLLLAVELLDYTFNKKVIDRCIEHGIITDWFLHCDNSMRIAPPLIITEDEIEKACGIIIESINYFHKVDTSADSPFLSVF